MARKTATVEREEDSVFVNIPVKDLPEDVKKRHKKRRIAMDVLHKKISKIHDEGEKDIKSLITKRTLASKDKDNATS